MQERAHHDGYKTTGYIPRIVVRCQKGYSDAVEETTPWSEASKAVEMGSLSIFHWLIVFLTFGSPIMGVIRGVKNSSIFHALLSVFIPAYGFIYFFAGKRDNVPDIKVRT
jgi:hypothetical protein